jgi:hypothetical protein
LAPQSRLVYPAVGPLFISTWQVYLQYLKFNSRLSPSKPVHQVLGF